MIKRERSLRPVPMLVGLLLMNVAGGCQRAPHPAEEVTQAPVQAQAASKIVMGEWTDLLGTTVPLPNRSARISAAVEGHVLTVLGDGKGSAVVEGEQVKAGQVVVQMDDRVLRANRGKLQAMLNDLEEQHKQAEFALELATIDVNRLKELMRSSPASGTLPLVSRVEIEKTQVLHKDAQSKLKSVAARQAAARADLKALDEQLKFFTLRAPISGRLSIVQTVPGQTLNPGAVVAEVVDLERIDVLCYAPPDIVSRLALDQPARLVVEESAAATSGPRPLGKVAFIGVQAQPETGNVAVKVRFPNPELRLRGHAIVHVHVLTRPEQERLTIPEAALMEDLDIPMVVVVQDVKIEKSAGEEHKIGKSRKLQVGLGVRDRDRGIAEILSLEDPATKAKVDPNDLLFVTAGGHGLRNDDMVKVEEPPVKK